MAKQSPKACPVCRAKSPTHFLLIDDQDYWRCQDCEGTFRDPGQLPPRQDEYAHYLLHENDPDDVGYRKFLSRLSVPLLEKLEVGCSGLDYGCGPGPALAAMMTEAGHDMSLYDPFFHPETDILSKTYDFITCSETVEHFHNPAEEFERLDSLLRPGGWLGIMTCFQTQDSRFANWHYRKDPTHVVFYREATFEKIAAQRDWICEFPSKDIVLMSKS